MNKSILRALIAAVAGMLLAGCAKEPAGGGEGIPMRVAAWVEGGTRASLTTDGLTEFYLQLGCADAAYGYFGKVTKSGTDWVASKQLLWKDETTPVNFSAAFFGDHAFTEDEFADGADLTLPSGQGTQAGLNGADLLTLKAADIKYEDTSGGVLPVTLGHGLTKVNFVLTLGEAFYDAKIGLTASPVTAFTVKGANAGFNFKPLTGAVTVTDGSQADITPLPGSYTPGTASSKAATAVFEAILVPQSFAAGKLIVHFSVGEGTYAWCNASAITLEAGSTVNLPLSAATAPPPPVPEAIDLGLSVKWASFNLGASKEWEYGDYYAWGETSTKQDYSWATYAHANGAYNKITKYCLKDKADYWDGTGDPDNKAVLDGGPDGDDVAQVMLGGKWRMPTIAEIKELLSIKWAAAEENSDYTWDTWSPAVDPDGNEIKDAWGNAVHGFRITRKSTGATLFLPAGGRCRGTSNVEHVDATGYYWSSSLWTGSQAHAYILFFRSDGWDWGHENRFCGMSVRPVTD